MADNTPLNLGSGGDIIATDELTSLNGGAVSGFKVQRVKVGFGSDAALQDVDAANGLPVVGTFFQATQPVSGTVALDTASLAALETISVANFPATQPVSGPLTDTQLRATAVPVSAASLPLPAGAATEATLALVSGTDVTTPSPAMPAGGVGIRGWLSAIWTKLNASLAVTGTFWQATQPVSGTVTANAGTGTLAVSLATAPTTPVTGTFWQATQPVSLAVNTPDVTDRAARLLGVVASITGALPAGANVIGALTANQSVNTAQIAGVATAVGSGVSGTGVQRMVLATDVILPAMSEIRAATLHVTATAAVNTAITATLPAPAAGLFHYITSVELIKLYNVVGVAAGAGVVVTSTNLPGTPAWTTEQAAGAVGTAPWVINYQPTTPLKCAVAATATTFVAPAQLQTIWRWNISYFTAA